MVRRTFLNHAIIQVGKDPWDHQIQPSPNATQSVKPYPWTPRPHISWVGSSTSLGSLFQHLSTHSAKKSFPIPKANLPWCNLRLFPWVLPNEKRDQTSPCYSTDEFPEPLLASQLCACPWFWFTTTHSGDSNLTCAFFCHQLPCPSNTELLFQQAGHISCIFPVPKASSSHFISSWRNTIRIPLITEFLS